MVLVVVGGFGCNKIPEKNVQNLPSGEASQTESSSLQNESDIVASERFHFATLDPTFRFSATLPAGAVATYVPNIQSIHITLPSDNNKSLFFIRSFEANTFLTLQTVTILEKESTTIHGHPATRYVIEKKNNVPDFTDQPAWRNQKHRVLDIRLTQNNPSVFYVFAYNPTVPTTTFDTFIESIIFDTDKQSFTPPLDAFSSRITKKPFGILIDKATSPVQPEKFSGYHTGVDAEIFADEQERDITVHSICGGPITSIDWVSGYGGVVTQTCMLGTDTIHIVYGHLNLASIDKKVGMYLTPGMSFAQLGKGFSTETDGERKHLHLGVFTGNSDIRGYVTSKEALGKWIDPVILWSE